MPRHNFSGSFTASGRKQCTNSIHPELVSINGSSLNLRKHNGGIHDGGEDTTKRSGPVLDDLFSSNIIRRTKSYMINVRADRLIHVQQYSPFEENSSKETVNESPQGERVEQPVVLFFIHGVGGSWRIWDSQIQHFFTEGYEVIALDLLGHGLSSTPDGYSPYLFSELAADVLFVFDKFCRRRNVLIGHSYGTSFCALLSTERRSLVSKIVMISGGGPTSLMPDTCSAFCLPMPLFFMIQPVLLGVFRRMAFHTKTRRAIRDKITTFGVSAHVLKAIMQGQRWEESDEEYHSDLCVPCLLIYGGGDQFVPLSDEVWMHETVYSSTLEVIEDAGHMVMIEAPDDVNRLITDFLNRDSTTQSKKLSNNSLPTSSSHNIQNGTAHNGRTSQRGTPRRTGVESVNGTPVKRSVSRLSRVSSGSYRGKRTSLPKY